MHSLLWNSIVLSFSVVFVVSTSRRSRMLASVSSLISSLCLAATSSKSDPVELEPDPEWSVLASDDHLDELETHFDAPSPLLHVFDHLLLDEVRSRPPTAPWDPHATTVPHTKEDFKKYNAARRLSGACSSGFNKGGVSSASPRSQGVSCTYTRSLFSSIHRAGDNDIPQSVTQPKAQQLYMAFEMCDDNPPTRAQIIMVLHTYPLRVPRFQHDLD
ncbi:unnamed protein product [Caenorhabditis nigoni]